MSKKKLITILAVLSALLVVAVASVVIVIVAGGNNISSNISIQYTSDGIMVDVSGSYTIGSTKTEMVAKRDGTEIGSVLSITPQAKTGELSPSGNITLTNDNTSVMFEFVFANTDTEADIELALTGTPSASNVLVKYVTLDYAMTNPDAMEGESSFANTLVATGKTKYVYVIVSLISHMYNATYSGSITWSMTRASINEINFADSVLTEVSNLYNSAKFAEAGKFLSNQKVYESDLPMPEKVNANFVGWYTDKALTTPATFPLTLNSDTHLYCKFLDANVSASCISYSSDEGGYYYLNGEEETASISVGIVPDLYDDGTHGVARLTKGICHPTNSYGGTYSYTTAPEIYFGNYMTEISNQVMGSMANGNSNITKVHLGRSIKDVEAFGYQCNSITDLYIPESIERIYTYYSSGFNWSSAMVDKVIICYNNSERGVFLRASSTLTNPSTITNWDKVAVIGEHALEKAQNLTTLILPSGCKVLGANAVWSSDLTTLSLNDGLEYIGDYAFTNCLKISTVTIPASVKHIGKNIAYHCGWKNIIVNSANPYYDSRNNCGGIIETATNTLICGWLNMTIPKSVTHIGDDAFSADYTASNYVVPDHIATIGNRAFYSCNGLTSVVISENVVSIGNNAFYECSNLTSVTFEDPNNWYTGNTHLNLSNPTTNATELRNGRSKYYKK